MAPKTEKPTKKDQSKETKKKEVKEEKKQEKKEVTQKSSKEEKSKKGSENINSHLNLVMKSGKVTKGYRSTLKNLRRAKSKK
jgi:hypothetical protein